MALYEIKEEKERVILVGVSTRENDDTEDSLDELKDLVKTAGAEAVGRVIQKRELVHPGTYVGKGKIEEIRELLWELDATGIVCDDELSPAQMNNLTDILDVKCDPALAGALCAAGKAGGILPGYHMNKNHWITILLDGTVKKERIFPLLEMSRELAGSGSGK